MKVEIIKEFNKQDNGVRNGDVCENCSTEEKPVYHLDNQGLGVDIILCPKCIDILKNEVSNIQIH